MKHDVTDLLHASKTSHQPVAQFLISFQIVLSKAALILGLYVYDPTRGLLCLLLLVGILLCVTSFLVVGVFKENTSEKSFHYSAGLIERAEAFIFFSLLILFPAFFTPLAALFIVLTLFTTAQRTHQFYSNN